MQMDSRVLSCRSGSPMLCRAKVEPDQHCVFNTDTFIDIVIWPFKKLMCRLIISSSSNTQRLTFGMCSYFWVKISVVVVFCDNRLWVTLLRSALLSSDQLGVLFVALQTHAADWEAAEYLLRGTMKHPYFNLIYQPTPVYQQMTNIFLSKKETGSTMLKILNHSKCRFQNAALK